MAAHSNDNGQQRMMNVAWRAVVHACTVSSASVVLSVLVFQIKCDWIKPLHLPIIKVCIQEHVRVSLQCVILFIYFLTVLILCHIHDFYSHVPNCIENLLTF